MLTKVRINAHSFNKRYYQDKLETKKVELFALNKRQERVEGTND